MSKETYYKEKLKCPLCPKMLSRANLARHRQQVHGDQLSSACDDGETSNPLMVRAVTVSDVSSVRSRSSSRDGHSRFDERRCTSTRSLPDVDGEDTSPTSILMRVAIAALDQHHCFTEEGLVRYVAETYPEVKPEEIRPLVIGAVAGAKRATRLQTLVNKCSRSGDSSTRQLATDGDVALSLWLNGLRYPSRPDVNFLAEKATTRALNQMPVSNDRMESSTVVVQLLPGVPIPTQLENSLTPATYTISDEDFQAVCRGSLQQTEDMCSAFGPLPATSDTTNSYDDEEVAQLLSMPFVSECLQLDQHPREVRVEITQNDQLLAEEKSKKEEKQRREEEEKSQKEEERRREEEEKSKKEEKQRREAEEKRRREEEEKSQREEKRRREAEEKSQKEKKQRREAEEKRKREEEEKSQREEKQRREAEEKSKRAEKRRREEEEKSQREEKRRREAEEKSQKEEKQRREAEEKRKREEEEKSKKEEKQRRDAEEKSKREEKRRREVEERSEKEQERRRREAEEKSKKEDEANLKERSRGSSVEDDPLIIETPRDFDDGMPVSSPSKRLKSVATRVVDGQNNSVDRQQERQNRPQGSFVSAERLRELLDIEARLRMNMK